MPILKLSPNPPCLRTGCDTLSDAGLSALGKGLPALASLNCSDCGAVTGAGFAGWRAADLTSLQLQSAAAVDDAGVAAIAEGLPSLRELNLKQCKRLTDAGVAALEPLARLTSLSLGAMGVTDAGLGMLARLRSLEELELQFCWHFGDAGGAGAAAAEGRRHGWSSTQLGLGRFPESTHGRRPSSPQASARSPS